MQLGEYFATRGLGAVAPPLDLNDPAVVLEVTSLFADSDGTLVTEVTPSTVWTDAASEAVLEASEMLVAETAAASTTGETFPRTDLVRQVGSHYYPTPVLLIALAAPSDGVMECFETDGQACDYPLLTDYVSACGDVMSPQLTGPSQPLAEMVALVNAGCPIVYPPEPASGANRGLVIGGSVAALVLVGWGAYYLRRKR